MVKLRVWSTKTTGYLEFSERCVDLHSGEIHLLGEAAEDGHVERVQEVTQVLADHLFGQPLAGDEEPGHSLRRILQEPSPDQVGDALLRLLVEDVEPGAVVPLPDDLVDGVAVADFGRRGASRDPVRLEPRQPHVDVAGVAVPGGGRKVGRGICKGQEDVALKAELRNLKLG